MKKYMVVRGRRRSSITIDTAYMIYGVFASSSTGEELEQEMSNYATEQFATVDKYTTNNSDVITYYRDLSFAGTPTIVGSVEFVVERKLGGVWYGFIEQSSINALFASTDIPA